MFDFSDLKNDLSKNDDALLIGFKRIVGYFISSSGAFSASDQYDIICRRVKPGGLIKSIVSTGDIVYGFFTNEPTISSVTYNNSRIVTSATTIINKEVPADCNWIGIRVPTGSDIEITPNSWILSNIDEQFSNNLSEFAYFTNMSFLPYQWIGNSGDLPSTGTAVSRMRTATFYHFNAGETLSVKWCDLLLFPIYCDANGICLNIVGNWFDSITFANDCYAYFNFRSDNITNFNTLYSMYGYLPHYVNVKNSKWAGKTWYSFGTSQSDINTDGATGNHGAEGRWPLVVDELSGLVRTNKAIGSGGICPSASHGGNVKTNILNCPYDVDLVTFECGLNDWGSVTLGEIGDVSNDTFIGNFTQCIQHLCYNTRARVVVVTMVGNTYTDSTQATRRPPFFKNSFGYYYRDYIDAMVKICKMYGVTVIDAEANALNDGMKNTYTIKDQTHMTWLGGQIFGRYVWEKLKNIEPYPKTV